MRIFTVDQKARRLEVSNQYKVQKRQDAVDILGGKCVNCGAIDNLQFDHINRDRVDSKHTIKYMIISTKWENVLEELKKCQLLCFPCHIKKSKIERGHTGEHAHGTTSKYRLGCRCNECRHVHADYLKLYHSKRKLNNVVI